jgi:hypothetical protein
MIELLKLISLLLLGAYVLAWGFAILAVAVVFIQHYVGLGFVRMFKS